MPHPSAGTPPPAARPPQPAAALHRRRHGRVRGGGVGGAEHRRAGDEQRRARLGARAGGRAVDAAVDLERPRRRRAAPACARSLASDRAMNGLAAPAGVDAHAEREVDDLGDLGERLGRRRRGDRDAGPAAGLVDRRDRVVDVRSRLGVDGDRVGPGAREVRDDLRSGRSTIRCTSISPPASCDLLAQRRDRRSGPCVSGGTKCPSITSTWITRAPGLHDLPHLRSQAGEVGRQDRRRDAHGRPRGVARRVTQRRQTASMLCRSGCR